MKDDPIISEERRVRETLWREAGCDFQRLAELARQETARLPNLGPRLENAEALRRYAQQQENTTSVLREQPPAYGGSPGRKE